MNFEDFWNNETGPDHFAGLPAPKDLARAAWNRAAQMGRDAGKRAALEKLRQKTAELAEHYRGDARRFALAGQYGTAREMAGNAEAHGLLCMEIGRELGLADGDALATPNVIYTPNVE